MKQLLTAVLALLALLTHGFAAATLATGAPASVNVVASDGSVRHFVAGDGSVKVVTQGDVVTWFIDSFTLAGVDFNGVQFSYDTDPFVTLTVGVFNATSNPLSFVFTIGAPFVGGPYDTVSSELTADVFSQELAASLTGISHQTRVDGVTQLVTTLPDCLDPVLDCGIATGSAGLVPASGATGQLASVLAFTVGLRDQATLQIRSDLFNASTGVPEPALLPLLLLVALAATAASASHHGVRRRRARPH